MCAVIDPPYTPLPYNCGTLQSPQVCTVPRANNLLTFYTPEQHAFLSLPMHLCFLECHRSETIHHIVVLLLNLKKLSVKLMKLPYDILYAGVV